MEVGQGLPEGTGQALASADTSELPESWTVARTASELPSGSDSESKFDRERSDSNVYSLVSQETRNVESDCSNRTTQELEELSVNAGLNSDVNAQENTYWPISSFVKNSTALDVMNRNLTEGSETGGRTSFDNSVNDSQSSAQFPKISEVGTEVIVSRDAEVGRQIRDKEEKYYNEMAYSDWCQPCRQKTGPCEDGHVSCEVRWSTGRLVQQVFSVNIIQQCLILKMIYGNQKVLMNCLSLCLCSLSRSLSLVASSAEHGHIYFTRPNCSVLSLPLFT